jgi:GNAT superfamily N-acetyltransferase
VGKLPVGTDVLRMEALAEGYQFIERLAADWKSHTIRFDRPGEALLAARLNGALVGVGGLTIEPIVLNAMRIGRFYVRPAFRRRGIGYQLAAALLARGSAGCLITVNAAPTSFSFWESIGFTPDQQDGHTHLFEADPKLIK